MSEPDTWKFGFNDEKTKRIVRLELVGFGFGNIVTAKGVPDWDALDKNPEYQKIVEQFRRFVKRLFR